MNVERELPIQEFGIEIPGNFQFWISDAEGGDFRRQQHGGPSEYVNIYSQHLQLWLCMTSGDPMTKTPTPRMYCASAKPLDTSLQYMDIHRAGARLPMIARTPKAMSV